MKLLITMDIRNKLFSVLFTFLMSLDMGDIFIIPHNLISRLSINSHSSSSSSSSDDYRTINTRLLPMVGALVTEDFNLNQVQVPGFSKDFSLVGDSFNGVKVKEDKLLYRLTESVLSHPSSSEEEQHDTSLENNAEELEDGEEEDSVEISRTVEPQVLQRLESKFLKLFGMNKRPERKSDKNLKVPKYLLELYQKQSGNDLPTSNLNLPGRHTRTANTVRTFYLEPGLSKDSKPVSSWKGHKNHLKFSLNSIPESEQVTGAELRVPFEIHINPHDSEMLSQLKSVKILIHDIIKPVTPPNSKKPKEFHLKEPITYPIDSKSVDLSKRRNGTSTFWLTFDVFPAVNRWITTQLQELQETMNSKKKKNTNHGLLLEIIGFTNEGQFLSQENLQHSHKLRVKRDLLDESSSSSLKSSSSLGKTSSSSSSSSSSSESSKTKTKSSVSDDEKGTEVGAVSAVIQQQNESVKQRSQGVPSSTSKSPIVLFTYSDDGRNGRKTRDAKTLSRHYRAAQNQKRRKNHRNKNRRRNLCARHNMFVDFTDVGWNDWIVAPPGYQAFHCSGECPFPMAEHLNATNHAVIQALVNSMNPGLVPPPCCVPTKYSSLSLLYTDSSDKIVLKNYNEMVVDSCGCS